MNIELLTALAVVLLLLVGRGILANESLKRLESRQRELFELKNIVEVQKKTNLSTEWGII